MNRVKKTIKKAQRRGWPLKVKATDLGQGDPVELLRDVWDGPVETARLDGLTIVWCDDWMIEIISDGKCAETEMS